MGKKSKRRRQFGLQLLFDILPFYFVILPIDDFPTLLEYGNL